MRKGLKRLLVVYMAVFLIISGITPAYAELSIEETRKLLQQSLTVVQIDEEISRITQEETEITIEIINTELEMTLQEKKTAKTRERLGKILRSYYKGERESLWFLLFNAKSFGQLLRMYNYLSYLYKSDEIAFQAYKDEYRALQNLRQKLEATKTGLAGLKQEFIKQRERIATLQQEIDQTLDAHPEAVAAIATQMEQIKNEWKEKGLPLFREYFSVISEAMQLLPEKIISDKENRYIKGTILKISDDDLTQMLRSEKTELQSLKLTFSQGQFKAENGDPELTASIVGYYTVEEDPNRLQFHVEHLDYNGFPLDETTNRTLEKDYDLSFTPGLVLPMLKAREVTTEDGMLTVKFAIKF